MGSTITTTPLFLFHLLMLLLFFFSYEPHPCSAVTIGDTLQYGQSLTGNQTLVSKGGVFELGFFSPGKSHRYYIGIWFKKITAQNKTVVWVANREKPLLNAATSKLMLQENGDLVLLSNESKIPIWSTDSTSKASKSCNAVLGDDGNLVVKHGSDPSEVVWQSFDHATDTFLPGSKLGYVNHITNETQKLFSWKNSEDPAEGIFSITKHASITQYALIWNGSQEFWNSGTWTGESFSNIPESLNAEGTLNFTSISNKKESYFTYYYYNDRLVSMLKLDLNGQLKFFLLLSDTWNLFWRQPLQKCHVYGLCGNFGVCSEDGSLGCQCLLGFEVSSQKHWDLLDYSGGCVRKTSLQCGDKHSFLKMPSIRIPTDRPNMVGIHSAEECKAACLNNCSCNAYAYDGTCSVWYETILNIEQLNTGGNDLFIKVAAVEDLNLGGRKNISTVWISVGAISGFIVLIVTVASALIIHKRMKKKKERTINNGTTLATTLDHDHKGTRSSMFNQYAFLTAFRYKDLKLATKNFSEKLGGGGFGCVFKGTLPDSTLIAVKKLESCSQGEKQFRSEVSTIGLIQHVNIVRLRGFCSKGTKKMLVYDFMPNGSLDSHLFHQNGSRVLNWKTRYQIALGTARGLAYLHEGCRDCILHCDIKPENILLDAELRPKVADFGLAKIVGREFSRVLTTIRGTIGYLAPEWSLGTPITTKADVYSYGMMLFEIISGRRNLKRLKGEKACYFPSWASKRLAEGRDVISLIDNKLRGIADVEGVTRALRVAAWCIQEEETQRPTMGQVVQILEELLEVPPAPLPTHLQLFVDDEETINFFTDYAT